MDSSFNVGYIIIAGLREATEVTDHDEDAWPWRCSLLDDYLRVFSCHIFDLHVLLFWIWCIDR